MSRSAQRWRDQMVTAGTIRIGGGSGIPAVLKTFGLDPIKVITDAGLLPSLFSDPDNIVPFAALGHLLAHCVKVTGCDHFGLLVGQHGDLFSLGKVGFVAQNSPDVGAALTSIATYLHHHDRGAAVTLSVEGRLTALGYTIYHQVEGADQISDGALAVGVRIMRTLCGTAWSPFEVRFVHRKPRDPTPYCELFRSKVRFSMHQTALLFETRWLHRPLPHAQPELRRVLLKDLEEPHTAPPSDLRDNVRQVARTMVGTRHCSAEAVAQMFGITERTLHRHLIAQGTSFKKLTDEIRYEMAKQLLREPAVPLGKIAEILDYSELSAFTRAFGRWSGMAPGNWRKKHASLERM